MEITTAYVALVIVVYALAASRIVRLINGDKVLARLRLYPAGKLRAAQLEYAEAKAYGQTARAERAATSIQRWDNAAYFVTCPWCVGMWVTFGTAWAPLYLHDDPIVRYVALALAVSHLIGVLARFADTEEIEIEDVAPSTDDD